MPIPFEPIAFFAAAFIAVGLANGLASAWAAGNHVKKAVETLKQAQAQKTAPEAAMQQLKKAAMDEMKRQEQVAARHPLVMVLNATQGLLFLAFIGFFFHEWMWFVAADLMATDVGRLWYSTQMGFLGITGGLVIFRLIASISSLNTTTIGPESTDGNWLAVVGDRRSAWAKLQKTLFVLSFLTAFGSIAYAATRIAIMTSSST